MKVPIYFEQLIINALSIPVEHICLNRWFCHSSFISGFLLDEFSSLFDVLLGEYLGGQCDLLGNIFSV